jgi:predicted exporter
VSDTVGATALTPALMPISTRRRVLTLALWLLAMALGVLLITRAEFRADLSAFLPANPNAQQRVLIDQLQSGAAARTLFIGIEGGNAAQRGAASRALGQALRTSGLFDQVQNGAQDGWQETGTWLFAHRYLLSPAISAERFTAAGLRDAIDETLSLLGTPAGSTIKPLLERDPTGETQRIAEMLIPSSSPRSEEGVWVSRSAPRAILLAGTRAAGSDIDGQAVAIDHIRTAFAAQPAQGLTLQVSGAGVFAVLSRAQIEHEVKLLTIAGSVLMGALLLLAFGSPLALGVAMLPVISGVIVGIVAVSLGFGTVHGITLGFGSTLIGEAVDYAIYFLIQARGASGGRVQTPGSGWRHWLVESWPTVRLGLLTSLCGFAALLFSGFPGLAQLGLFSIAGLVAATVTTRYVLPVLMPDGAAGLGLRRHIGAVAAWGVARLPRLRGLFLGLGVAALALLFWHRGDLWHAQLSSLSPIPREALALDQKLRADLSTSDAGTLVVVDGKTVELALQAAEVAGARLDGLVDQGQLGGYTSPARLLPSLATQQRRQAQLPEATALREQLALATQAGPLPAQRLEPFIAEVQAARALTPVTPAALAGGPLAPLIDALLLRRADGSASVLIALQPAGSAGIDATRVGAALAGLPGAQVIDIGHELNSLYGHYLGEAMAQASLGALAVVLLLAAWLRSGRRLLTVCWPLALAVLLTLGMLTALQVQMGVLHLVGLLLVVAVGSNYALFFDQLQRDGRADADTLTSLLLANVTTVLSFGLIAMSAIPALSAIGRVVAPGALLALLLAAAFAPGVRPTVRPATAR